jgi:hypothetical protein
MLTLPSRGRLPVDNELRQGVVRSSGRDERGEGGEDGLHGDGAGRRGWLQGGETTNRLASSAVRAPAHIRAGSSEETPRRVPGLDGARSTGHASRPQTDGVVAKPVGLGRGSQSVAEHAQNWLWTDRT